MHIHMRVHMRVHMHMRVQTYACAWLQSPPRVPCATVRRYHGPFPSLSCWRPQADELLTAANFTVLVTGLPPNLSTPSLRSHCTRFGEVVHVGVALNNRAPTLALPSCRTVTVPHRILYIAYPSHRILHTPPSCTASLLLLSLNGILHTASFTRLPHAHVSLLLLSTGWLRHRSCFGASFTPPDHVHRRAHPGHREARRPALECSGRGRRLAPGDSRCQAGCRARGGGQGGGQEER